MKNHAAPCSMFTPPVVDPAPRGRRCRIAVPRSIMHSIQPKADLTGVAPADGAGVNNGPHIIREIF